MVEADSEEEQDTRDLSDEGKKRKQADSSIQRSSRAKKKGSTTVSKQLPQNWISEHYSHDILRRHGSGVQCISCGSVFSLKKSTVDKHLQSEKHAANLKNRKEMGEKAVKFGVCEERGRPFSRASAEMVSLSARKDSDMGSCVQVHRGLAAFVSSYRARFLGIDIGRQQAAEEHERRHEAFLCNGEVQYEARRERGGRG